MNTFYYIPNKELVNHSTDVFCQIINLEGAHWDLNHQGLIIDEGSRAHVRAGLLGVPLLKGEWQAPETV